MSVDPVPESPATARADPVARGSAADIRRWIVAELARSLRVDPAEINVTAPLDTLGIDSLAAIGMTGGLASYLDRDLPVTLVWDHPTIAAIAEALAQPATVRPLPPGVIDLQPLGTRRPLFFFPGLGGHPVSFARLAADLGADQPSYGLIVPGPADGAAGPARVEDLATTMLAAIRAVQPRGPYQLAGYSFGGLLAYEAARQLAAAGELPSLLAVYDAFTPAGRVVRPAWQRLVAHGYLLATRPGRLRYLGDRMRRPPPPTRATGPTPVNRAAAARYDPPPFAGTVVVFRATQRPVHNLFYKVDATNGWAAVAGHVRVVDLPGTHLNMLGLEHAGAAAAALRPFLDESSPAG